ncbi:uncharacterized protein LOC135222689 isoform X2 [Macrobrachium nipponense]|uniref:uncharacterized protein LOC135222689 isoform X2 n=1 Tax=Macrobrachium nipponense TaxID=159736 RepID=UPI0030C81196
MKAFWCLFALEKCPPGFDPFFVGETSPDACLRFAMDVKREWHEAKSYCESLLPGGYLAILDEENLHWSVISYILSHPEMLNEGFHIGCTDEVNEGV